MIAYPYEFFMRSCIIPNRDLTLIAPFFRNEPHPETIMSDILYLALGLGTFAVLALYARGLGRI